MALAEGQAEKLILFYFMIFLRRNGKIGTIKKPHQITIFILFIRTEFIRTSAQYSRTIAVAVAVAISFCNLALDFFLKIH